ncbi:hypothetical protein G6F22_018014 [Rhizopus arrhizus]|nr:hypothetical protein G6F22_018014 [Rhizopus arrhizus]
MISEAALGAPILGQLDRRALQLAVLFQLGLEQLEQGEGIGGGTGEAGQHLAVAAQAAHLARIALHHGVAQRDLAVAGNGHVLAATDADDGGGLFTGHGDSAGCDQACADGCRSALCLRRPLRIGLDPLGEVPVFTLRLDRMLGAAGAIAAGQRVGRAVAVAAPADTLGVFGMQGNRLRHGGGVLVACGHDAPFASDLP